LKDINITTNNKNDPEYEVMLDALVGEVFGFSFDTWFERKLWDDNYISYSIIDNGKMQANLCVFDNEMIVGGKRFRAIQLGAVCTSKSARGKGLSRQLIERALSDYDGIPAFLFANESVIDFYPRFGFRQIQAYRPVLNVGFTDNIETAANTTDTATGSNDKRAVKLDVDDPIVKNAINNRGSFSNILDCLNTASIQMFHLLKDYLDDIYHLPSLDVIVVAYQDNNRLFIADIISKNPITFESITPCLPFKGIDTIEFGFSPDHLNITPIWEPVPLTDVMLFTKGTWNLPPHFRIPAMSET